MVVNGVPGIMYFHYNHDFQMSILPVRFAWSKVILRGGRFDGLSDLDEIFPSVKTDLSSDRRISPSSVGKYVLTSLRPCLLACLLTRGAVRRNVDAVKHGNAFLDLDYLLPQITAYCS